MKGPEKPVGFRVLIVGGGIAGLTLANALQHAQIDYLLLESRAVIDPQLGASIGIAPNGGRILDQLSCFEDIERLTEPLESAGNHAANGDDLVPRSDGFQLVSARTNYAMCFLDRQIVLRVLANHILDPSKILLNKQISKVEHASKRVVVHCTDGSCYAGDIVAGADGAFSKVRKEMWRAANAAKSGDISEKEQNSMAAEYKCLYGISSATVGLPIRNYDVTYMRDRSTMVITGKGGRVFWFLFSRMPQTYRAGKIPHFTSEEAEKFANENLDIPILPRGVVRFADIWKNRQTFTLVATEEADYDHWTWGRFACLGDSIHKVTPNMGVGGMQAVESAAALANTIQSLVAENGENHPSMGNVRQALLGYQGKRKVRTSALIKAANALTRIQALRGIKERILAHYILPNAGDQLVDVASDGWVGATQINYLPPPPRSLNSKMPFNPEQGLGQKESQLRRAIVAMPFLVMAIWCYRIIMDLIPWESGNAILESRLIVWGESSSIQILDKFYHWKFLDDRCRGSTLLMAPSTLGYDSVSSSQMFTFLADCGLTYAILLIESARRASVLTPTQIPLIFGMLSMHGIGFALPLYYFLHYTTTPIANFKAADMRLTDLSYTLTVLPTMAAGYYAPYLVGYLAPENTTRHVAMWLWHMFPIWVTLGQWLLARTVMPSTMQRDRIQDVTRDLWPIRITIGMLTAFSSLVWLTAMLSVPFPMRTLFIPSGDDLETFVGSIRELLQYDQLFSATSSILWIIYLFSDLKRAGMLPQSWSVILGILGSVLLFLGPGAATAVGWLWREEVLATKKHKGAVVSGWTLSEGQNRLAPHDPREEGPKVQKTMQ